MLKKSILVLSLTAILISGCSQEKPKVQEQLVPQAKPSVQVQTQSSEPQILNKKIIDKYVTGFGEERREVIVEERQIERTLPNGKKKYEIQYFNAKTGDRLISYEPNKKTESFQPIQNQGKDVSDFRSH